jgi:hypothetical protein
MTIRAQDMSGNAYSATINITVANTSAPPPPTPVPTPSPTPTPTPTPTGSGGPLLNAFNGCYYNNLTLSGTPALIRSDNQINFNFAAGAPGPEVNLTGFSARWQGNFTFEDAAYTLVAYASDGIRMYVDGGLVLNQWKDQTGSGYRARVTMTPGTHLITVEYYDNNSAGMANVYWVRN